MNGDVTEQHVSHAPRLKLKRQYTVRKSPYWISLFFLFAATALTLLNVYVADLIHVVIKSPGPLEFETKYGLYQRCTRKSPVPNVTFLRSAQSLPQPGVVPVAVPAFPEAFLPPFDGADGEGDGWVCQPFPSRSECAEFGESSCVLWSTAGYMAQLSLVPCLAALIALLFIFLHRGQKGARARARRKQWKLVSGTMTLHFVLQVVSVALILHVYRTDGRFEYGAHLDRSFIFGIASAVTSGAMVLLMTLTGLSARAGHPWAAGKSARQARRHRRTRSGRVVVVPEGTRIPAEERLTVGEVRAAVGDDEEEVETADERTGLLDAVAEEGRAAGGGKVRATD